MAHITKIPLDKAEKYLEEVKFRKSFTEEDIKEVFVPLLKQYSDSKISARFINAVAVEILNRIWKAQPGIVTDAELLDVIEKASDLESSKFNKTKLLNIKDSFKEYLRMKEN